MTELDDAEAGAGVAESHISWVFFAGDRAYKLLKPLRTAFLDYSTPETAPGRLRAGGGAQPPAWRPTSTWG